MKLKHLFLTLVTTIPFISFAQYGTVKSYYKVTATSIGITGLFEKNQLLGLASTLIGDINQDGVVDVATSIFAYERGRSYVVIIFMNANGTVMSHNLIGEEEGLSDILFSPYFARSIISMGDLDGDGTNDIAVGDSRAGATLSQTGAVTLIYLNRNGTVKTFRQISRNVINSLPRSGYFGSGLANVGDIDMDGYTDLVVSSSNEVLNGVLGCIYILYLDSVQNLKSFQKIGVDTNGTIGSFSEILRFAEGINSIGDFNRDGRLDITFSVLYGNNASDMLSGFCIASLTSDGTLKNISSLSNQNSGLNDIIKFAAFGQSVVNVNDLDGDGVDELAVGAPFDTSYGSSGGSVRILFMNPDATVKSVQKIDNRSGNFNQFIADQDDFGRLSILGDFNKDGITDLLVGSSGKDEGGIDKGALYLLMLNGVPSVGLNDVHANRIQVNLYPNPTKYQVQVSCPYPVTQITITDVTGKIIYQQKNNEPIQVQTWQAGMYYLQVNTTHGTAVQKLVKQ